MHKFRQALLCAALISGGQVLAEDRSKEEAANVSATQRFFNAGWGTNEGWQDHWRSAVSEDATSYFHAFPPITGVENMIDFNADLFVGFPRLEMSVQGIVAEGNTVVVTGHLNGIHDGLFLGVPASGAEVSVPDVTILTFRDRQIVEMRYFTDLMAVMTLIGALPPNE
ncbi:ester cyclase [Rhodophyticola porphyridii]|uniref:ester cyclase n=1 Tax=Rhodophyticola porphyridii TaxID=1852017 RepID=UPI0035D0FCEC